MTLSSTSIRFRLLALLCASLFPVVLFSLYLAEERRIEGAEHAREDVSVLARLTAAAHENILGQSHQLLAGLTIGNDGVDEPLLGPDCSAHLQRVASILPLYKQVVLARPDGEVYCAAEPLQQAINLGGQTFFVEILAGKTSTHSSIVTSELTGTPGIILAEPVLDSNGELMAVLVAVLGLDWIGERLQNASLPPDGGVTLIDSDGVVLAAFPGANLKAKTIMEAEDFKRAILQADEGFTQGRGIDGMERLRAFIKLQDLPGRGVYLSVDLPLSEINEAAVHTFRHMLMGLLLTFAAAVAGGWTGTSAFVVKPLQRLTTAADRLGKGDLTVRTGVSHEDNEIGRMATKFDELASHVQRTTRALKALSAGNRLILRERDENLLLKSMCAIAVDKGGYALAVVNFASGNVSAPLQLMAMAGNDEGFVKTANESFNASAGESSTVGRVLRTGERCLIKSLALNNFGTDWREAALARGFCSVVSFPLKVDDATIGVFTLMSSQEDALDDEELELLDEMAADLSFGIATIRFRKKLEEAENTARRATSHDLLTDLPNGATFLASLTHRIAEAQLAKQSLAILVVHLARLQEVYDTLGYELGNLIVKEVSRRLHELSELDGSLARLGLEDFGIVLIRGDARAAESLVKPILAQCQLPVQVSGAHFEIQVAVGASFYPGHGDKPEVLVRRATIAARGAKHRGISYLSYQGTIEHEDPQWLTIAAELRHAIEQQTLILHYQSKLDLKSGHISSCEALIRWNHPRKGMMSPAQFIPVAEQTGLIREMTYFVVEAAVRQQRRWMDIGKQLPIAVNLSVRNLYDAQLLERIEGLLSTWGVPPALIEFEITESALMEEPEVARAAIAQLRSKGARIYIDDFGTGYSSLSYLVSLPVHALKIDRAFVVQMTKSRQARAVVASIITMAHELGLKVVAEGVETAEELAQLKDMGCDDVQGYFTGRPLSGEDFIQQTRYPYARAEDGHETG